MLDASRHTFATNNFQNTCWWQTFLPRGTLSPAAGGSHAAAREEAFCTTAGGLREAALSQANPCGMCPWPTCSMWPATVC